MAKLSDIAATKLVRILQVGNSGSGKTGALVSLVKAGYRLRIYDLDNGLDALINEIKVQCPDKLDAVEAMQFRDKYVFTASGPMVKGTPKALNDCLKALEKWDDGTDPSTWGPDTILVLDSLTALGRAAFAWANQLHMGTAKGKEPRLIFGEAQRVIERTLETLTAPSFGTNVIVTTHIDMREQPDGTVKGWPSSIGEALGPKIAGFFNTMLIYETSGSGANVKRKIKTLPTAIVDAKNPAPQKIEAVYDINQLDVIFENLRNL